MRPITASVVGRVSDTKWGQVLITPHAYGVVEVHSPDGIARVRGLQLLTKLTREFVTPPVSLSALSTIADSVRNEEIISLILLVPVGTTLYLVSRGNGAVYLQRKKNIAKLLEGTGALSGDVHIGDAIITATRGFVEALTQEEIVGVFDHLAPQEIAEKMTIRLHEREGGEGGAALIFMMGEAVAEEETPTKITSKPRSSNKGVSRRQLVAIVIVTLFIVSVILGIRRQYTTRVQSTLAETVSKAQHSFDEGMALMELNPVKGRERLSAARDLLTSSKSKEAKALYEEIDKNLTRAMRITTVTPELFFDMELVKAGAIASDISLFESMIGVIDTGGSTAFTLGVSVKNGMIVAGGSAFSGATHIAAYGDKLYVWTPQGIHQIRLSDQKTVSGIIPTSTQWGTVTDIVAFGGNVYLLDTSKSRIWKYVATKDGFSTMYEYLNPDTLPDLTKSTNMAIDGSVWLGTTTGTILRFTAGKENSFTPQGIDTPLGKKLTVYTSDETKMVYMLDHENRRVAVFDKDGLYMAQYVWEAEFAPTSFVVSEEAEKIFFLRDGKIYSIQLE